LRTAADFNLHVDKDFNLQVDGNFNVKVKNAFNLETTDTVTRSEKETKIFGGTLSLGSNGRIDLDAASEGSFTAKAALKFTGEPILMNSGRGPKVSKPRDIAIKTHPDTKKDGNGQWQIEPDKIKSVAKIVPTHEPWERKNGVDSTCCNTPAGPSDSQSLDITQGDPPESKSTSTQNNSGTENSGNSAQPGQSNPLGIADAESKKVTGAAPASLMKDPNAPNHPNGFGNGLLSPDQAKALSVQLAYNESRNNYEPDPPNPYGYVGKYQMGAAALVDAGYIKPSAYEQRDRSKNPNDVLNDNNAWTGKDGVYSKSGFVGSPAAQENAHVINTENIIRTGLKSGYISKSDDAATTGGKIMAAHLLGVSGAKKWLQTGEGQDAFGSTGSAYYNRGRYAVNVLADKA
jgi:hypothetical protein